MKILVIDVGGTNVKLQATGSPEVRKVESGPDLTPEQLVHEVRDATPDWEYEAVTIGYPGVVIDGAIRKAYADYDFGREDRSILERTI